MSQLLTSGPQRSRASTSTLPTSAQLSRPDSTNNPTTCVYRLQLRLYKLDSAGTEFNEATRLRWFNSPEKVNEAALDLAKTCRSEGEVVMLIRQQELVKGPPAVLLKKEYLIGKWISKNKTDLPMDSFALMLEPQGFINRDPKSSRGYLKVSGQVKVVEEQIPRIS